MASTADRGSSASEGSDPAEATAAAASDHHAASNPEEDTITTALNENRMRLSANGDAAADQPEIALLPTTRKSELIPSLDKFNDTKHKTEESDVGNFRRFLIQMAGPQFSESHISVLLLFTLLSCVTIASPIFLYLSPITVFWPAWKARRERNRRLKRLKEESEQLEINNNFENFGSGTRREERKSGTSSILRKSGRGNSGISGAMSLSRNNSRKTSAASGCIAAGTDSKLVPVAVEMVERNACNEIAPHESHEVAWGEDTVIDFEGSSGVNRISNPLSFQDLAALDEINSDRGINGSGINGMNNKLLAESHKEGLTPAVSHSATPVVKPVRVRTASSVVSSAVSMMGQIEQYEETITVELDAFETDQFHRSNTVTSNPAHPSSTPATPKVGVTNPHNNVAVDINTLNTILSTESNNTDSSNDETAKFSSNPQEANTNRSSDISSGETKSLDSNNSTNSSDCKNAADSNIFLKKVSRNSKAVPLLDQLEHTNPQDSEQEKTCFKHGLTIQQDEMDEKELDFSENDFDDTTIALPPLPLTSQLIQCAIFLVFFTHRNVLEMVIPNIAGCFLATIYLILYPFFYRSKLYRKSFCYQLVIMGLLFAGLGLLTWLCLNETGWGLEVALGKAGNDVGNVQEVVDVGNDNVNNEEMVLGEKIQDDKGNDNVESQSVAANEVSDTNANNVNPPPPTPPVLQPEDPTVRSGLINDPGLNILGWIGVGFVFLALGSGMFALPQAIRTRNVACLGTPTLNYACLVKSLSWTLSGFVRWQWQVIIGNIGGLICIFIVLGVRWKIMREAERDSLREAENVREAERERREVEEERKGNEESQERGEV